MRRVIMELPRRKKIRLDGFDYSCDGLYFVTLCVLDRHEILWDNVGANSVRPPHDEHIMRPHLSEIGLSVRNKILKISECYSNVYVDRFCILPNHIHMIICIYSDSSHRETDVSGRTLFAPTDGKPGLSGVIKQFKGAVTKELGFTIWQKSFYDVIIRNKKQYEEICEYIHNNPLKYADKYMICSE